MCCLSVGGQAWRSCRGKPQLSRQQSKVASLSDCGASTVKFLENLHKAPSSNNAASQAEELRSKPSIVTRQTAAVARARGSGRAGGGGGGVGGGGGGGGATTATCHVNDWGRPKGWHQRACRPPSRSVEITNTWRDVKRALSLLCVKTSTSSAAAAMLEAPPGSREDLVEAARTPCTPSELDTMLYGYTNSIYVLDHTPESLPDMDMLQLFASPAGRALVSTSATREERQQHQHQQPQQRSATSTSSLGRELVSGLASGVASSPSSFSSTSTSTSSPSASSSSSTSTSAASNRRPGTVSAPTSPPGRQRKSSTELYKEAIEILGLTCTLSDSCRCIDCQSNYFDYDDDYGEVRTELAAGTPILLDHALTHPLACSIQ